MDLSNLSRIGQIVFASTVVAYGFGAGSDTYAQGVLQGYVPPPIARTDFHFSDRARDARYWQLHGEVERTMAAFMQVAFAAGDAVAVPGPQPGSPAWLAARTQIERALLARRPAREALNALIFYLRRERPQLTAEEAEEADNIIRVHEETLLATSDHLVDLFARLAGVRVDHWPP